MAPSPRSNGSLTTGEGAEKTGVPGSCREHAEGAVKGGEVTVKHEREGSVSQRGKGAVRQGTPGTIGQVCD
jgi:hypothetical protein